MKRTVRLSLVAALLLSPLIAHAQGSVLGWGSKAQTVGNTATNPQGALKVGIIGGIKSDSTASPFRFDALGYPFFTDGSRDRDNWRIVSLINNQLTASGSGMVDSTSIPIATYDLSRMSLLFKFTPDSLSSVVRFAVEVRGHYNTNNDTSSTFVWHRWPTRATSNGTTDVDSLGHMFVGSYSQAQVTSANAPFANATGAWPGEFVVKYNVASNDSTAAGNGKYGAFPNTIQLPLCDGTGAWYMAPYTSVRVRVLSGVRSRVKVRVDLMGVGK